MALLAVAPAAYGGGTSEISGNVTENLSHPLSGVSVTVFGASHEVVGSAPTGTSGEYTVSGLAPGAYTVAFLPSLESIFAPQYYKGAFSFSEATSVTILNEGEDKSGIDATLREGGTISGKVEGPLGEPIRDVAVGALGQFLGLAFTNEAGEYTVKGLAKGSYVIEFLPPESEANLVPQFYNGVQSFGAATRVEVKEGEAKHGVNAVLQEGGEISGTVTDAANQQPLAEVCVTATNSHGGEFFGFTETAANGEYVIHGLEEGSYEVEFNVESEYCSTQPAYLTQFTEAAVRPGFATEINAPLVPSAPVNTAPPVLSGTPAVGQVLSCFTGSWTGLAPLEFGYAWLRDGGAIGGESAATYEVQPADQGHGLTCQVTATNSVSHAAATSNTLNVLPPPPPPRQAPPPLSAVGPFPSPVPPPPPPPTIEKVTQSRSSWREGSKLASYSRKTTPPVGTTISLVLNEQAAVSFVFTQQVSGRVTGGNCVAQTNRNRRKPGCKRTVTQGTLSFSGHDGLNKVAFQGRISRSERLPLGAYTLRITAMNSAGQRSSPRSLNFTIVK